MKTATRRVPWRSLLLSRVALIAMARCALAVVAQAPVPGSIQVPKTTTDVLFGSQTQLSIDCNVLPFTSVRVGMNALDGDGAPVAGRVVEPGVLVFTSVNSSTPVAITHTVTVSGVREGRYYLTYALVGGDVARYRLSARSSVLVVTDEAQGWKGIWYELGFNGAIFVAAVAFFAWRRLHRVDLPIWQRHRAGLFERVNYDDLPQKKFEKRYRDIQGGTLRERMWQYWEIPSDGNYMCHTSGIAAALLLRFYIDAGHLCAILTLFSVATLLPVNFLSGDPHAVASASSSFQQFTISNVPLYSDWFWVHVGYCYLVAFLLLAFLTCQHTLLATLRRRTKRIVGGRSILIHSGLPPSMTTKKLRALLAEYYDTDKIDDVTVVYDFHKLHHLLDRRQEVAQELDRLRGLDAGYEHGMLSCSLLWCPGPVLLPSPTTTLFSYLTCRPCRYYARHTDCRCCCGWRRGAGVPEDDRLTYSKVSSEREIVNSRLAREFEILDEELDFFPEEAVDMYEQRQCLGAAFVVFDSAATRDDFVRLVHEQSCVGRLVNVLHDRTYSLHHTKPRPPSPRRSVASTGSTASTSSATSTSSLAPYLANLVLTSAPEPDDVLWKNLRYAPRSVSKLALFVGRQVATLALLLLFSTPTAVLVYIKLDSSSSIYRQLYARHWVLVSMFASYLPSLLLIAVNWGLLTFLYYLAMLQPSISDSRRTKSFLVTGFVYLVVSSVFLPSIGVTAAYLAFSELGANHKNYVESFLYKVSGTTFFLSYICQRAFLGSMIELTRLGERIAYQPWVLARSVTPEERREARKPLPYYFGHDYAVLTSVLLVILLGSVITPIITPFGALFFYLKVTVTKYNFLYVLQYTPGRGHVAQTAYSLVVASLVLFQVVMAFVFLQLAGRRQFVAMVVLLGITAGVYFFYIADMSARVKQSKHTMEGTSSGPLLLSTGAGKIKSKASKASYQSPKNVTPSLARRTIFSPVPLTLEEDLGLLESYTDPYKVALSVFKLLGVHEHFHRMTSTTTQLRYAFHRLKRHAPTPLPRQPLAAIIEYSGEEDGGVATHEDAV